MIEWAWGRAAADISDMGVKIGDVRCSSVNAGYVEQDRAGLGETNTCKLAEIGVNTGETKLGKAELHDSSCT